MSRRIVLPALRRAVEARRAEGSLIHHPDRGGQYSSDDLRDQVASHSIDCSFSSYGNCATRPGLDPRDNAAMECFSGLLKRQRVNRVRYRTRDEGRADLFDHIKVFYNGDRRHGYVETSARTTPKHSRPDLFEPSTETGQDQ